MVRTPLTHLPGLLLSVALAAAALLTAEIPWVRDRLHWSALLIVILFGMAWKSLAPLPEAARPGIRLAQRPVLRWAVAGLGFRLSLPELWAIDRFALDVAFADEATLAQLRAEFDAWAANVPELEALEAPRSRSRS